MTKRAFLVLGPESTGTRLMTKLLMDVGCWGDDGHEQRLDKPADPSWESLNAPALPSDERPLVWRRSVPHARAWVRIPTLVEQLKSHGYQVVAAVTTRDWFPTMKSQIKEGYARTEEEAVANIRRAYIHILAGLAEAGVPYVGVSYEALAAYKEKAARRALEMLGFLRPSLATAIGDGNAKWYADE